MWWLCVSRFFWLHLLRVFDFYCRICSEKFVYFKFDAYLEVVSPFPVVLRLISINYYHALHIDVATAFWSLSNKKSNSHTSTYTMCWISSALSQHKSVFAFSQLLYGRVNIRYCVELVKYTAGVARLANSRYSCSCCCLNALHLIFIFFCVVHGFSKSFAAVGIVRCN